MEKRKIIFIIILILVTIIVFYIKINSKSLLIKLFNCSILIITSGSMEPEISVGEAVIIKTENTYEVGDIVTYNVEDKYLVTHRIVNKDKENYITKGDKNNTNDKEKITNDNIEGKVIYHSKFISYLVKYSPIIIMLLIIILVFL